MTGVRAFLQTQAGKIVGLAVTVLFLVIAGFSVASFMKTKTPDAAFYTTYICTETGKPFRHKNEIGETLPIVSPYNGKNTGMPAEACYWTADGSIKDEPTWVLLNQEIGKSGPTFCPDCGRLVVGHNPRPEPGAMPPPTEEQYNARHSGRQH